MGKELGDIVLGTTAGAGIGYILPALSYGSAYAAAAALGPMYPIYVGATAIFGSLFTKLFS